MGAGLVSGADRSLEFLWSWIQGITRRMVAPETVAAVDVTPLGDQQQSAIRVLLNQPWDGAHGAVGDRVGYVAGRPEEFRRAWEHLTQERVLRVVFSFFCPFLCQCNGEVFGSLAQKAL